MSAARWRRDGDARQQRANRAVEVRIRLERADARGDAREGSDLDLLVDLEPGRSLLDLVAIKQDLEDLLGRDVDVVTEAGLSPYLRDQALREAVAL